MKNTVLRIHPKMAVYAILSFVLLAVPFAAEKLYTYVWEYSRHTFVIEWKYIFLYALVILLGMLLCLHVFMYLCSGVRRSIVIVLSLLLLGEAIWLFYKGFAGSIVAALLFAFVFVEALFPKKKA